MGLLIDDDSLVSSIQDNCKIVHKSTVKANFVDKFSLIFGRCVIEKDTFWNLLTFTNTAIPYNTRDQLHERMIPQNLQSAEASKKSFLSFFFYRRARSIVYCMMLYRVTKLLEGKR